MATRFERTGWTYAEYARLPDDGNRYEVIGGELHVTPAPRPIHQEVLNALNVVLRDFAEVGRALGVATVLDRSVRRDGDNVRITVQLLDASSGYQLWADSFEQELSEIFAVQDEISRAIVSALRIRLPHAVAPRQPPTRNSEAYELYLMGRYFWNQRTEDALLRATAYFRQAAELDPDYAQAYAGLADVDIAPRAGRPAERFARA